MRIAWLGLAPTEDSGTSYIGVQLLVELDALGVEVDCYAAAERSALHPRLDGLSNVRFFCLPSGWQADRWYSRAPLAYHLTLQGARVVAQARLAKTILERHRLAPYDVIHHFSQIELFALRRHLGALPPVVVHPGAHAAGELRWHRREQPLALAGESRARNLAVRSMLTARAATQRRDVRLVEGVLVPSDTFAAELAADYRIARTKVRTLPNPVDLDRFRPSPDRRVPGAPRTLLFVSRMAVRKGVELVVDLSHRLADLRGQVRIVAVGPHDQWSDYRHLLDGLHPEIGSYIGSQSAAALAELYRDADVLILPSHYEPFSLAVGEALASGVPVVASSAVGAAEGLGSPSCDIFPAGDGAAFEAAVRRMLDRLDQGGAPAIAAHARAEAERRWHPRTIATQAVAELTDIVARARS